MNSASKQYVRDKRSPKPKSEVTSRVMSANKAKDTKPELLLRKALWSQGKRGYRLHERICGTRPDIVYKKQKVAIFVHGCFWHRCPKCGLTLPKNNRVFWNKKFKANQDRDKNKIEALQSNGWKVLVFWECDIRSDIKGVLERFAKFMC